MTALGADRAIDGATVAIGPPPAGQRVVQIADRSPDETPLDRWMHRQHDLSAVERFARHHLAPGALPADRRWRDRLPARAPGPGTQYGFEVDLDACTGCKACVAACHQLNGLPDDEAWRRVGTLHAIEPGSGEPAGATGGPVTVTGSCHHCVDPGCLRGCPARAYEKDPVTGIVRHLDDACIGCSYCTLTCPYEVPTYRPDLGIVRKCDLCADRLAVGEAPACVQGCPQGAITVAVVDVAELVASARPAPAAAVASPRLVPTAPSSALTVPATRYRSATPLSPSLVAGDRASIHPSAGHPPLAVLLVLTQAAVGTTLVGLALEALATVDPARTRALAVASLVAAGVAVAASVLHLGRPLLAWRAVLGVRTSWLSREVVAFGAYSLTAAARTIAVLTGAADGWQQAAGVGAACCGLVGLACSVQLYAVTGRRWWRWPTTGGRFAASAAALGAITVLVAATATRPAIDATVLRGLAATGLCGLAASWAIPLLPLLGRPAPRGRAAADPELDATAHLLRRRLRPLIVARSIGTALAAIALVIAFATATGSGPSPRPIGAAAAALMAATAGELLERLLFFRASVAPRMPGRRR